MVNEVMDFITGYDKEVGEAIQAECARRDATWNSSHQRISCQSLS